MTKMMDPRWREVSWQRALSQATPAIARVLEAGLEGRELDFASGMMLATVRGSDLLALVKVADDFKGFECAKAAKELLETLKDVK